MNHLERRDRELPYISDAAVMEEQRVCRKILQELNTIDRSDFDGISKIAAKLLGKSERAFINPPFYCDYGSHIEVGKNLFMNYNCTIIDVAKVVIGDNCQIAPNVAIYTAGHPVHPDTRNTLYDWRQYSYMSGSTYRKQYRHRCRKCSYKGYSRLGHCCRESLQSNPQHYRRRPSLLLQRPKI